MSATPEETAAINSAVETLEKSAEFTRGAREGWMRACVFYKDMCAEADPEVLAEMDRRWPTPNSPPCSPVETNGWPEIVVPPSHPMAGKPGFRVNVPLPDYDAPGVNDDPMAAERAVYLQQPPKHDELCTCGHARASHGGEGCFMFACWCAGFTLNAPPP